ncbi:MAG TPA: hypothetical protein VFC38_07070 [Stellaceae bacterium]|nr:hypothetical protein [Stellaceae bacterium]
MDIVKTADDGFRLALSSDEGRVFVNCIYEATRALGKRDFAIRVGGTTDEVGALSSAIEAALK